MTTLKNKQTIDALLDGEVVFETSSPNVLFRMNKGELQLSNVNATSGWHKYNASLNWLLEKEFSTYKFVPEVGQWVEATKGSSVFNGKITKIEGNEVYACWDEQIRETWLYLDERDYRVMSEEEVKNHRMEMEFKKVGRESREYVPGDIVKYGSILAEVKGQYKRASSADLLQRLIIQFATDDTQMGMCRHDVGAFEVTPKCLKEHVINLGEDEL
ncbi:hypothetical protein AVV02_gp029 [Bacillus phage AvesoBmore]|uniref:Uncharacterized protein n=1 Tax=Bacillus phage AvesoBmore TaxID=1698451 RepID=A0A0K2D102_9CAUD|nr:hypothetical protein AVV02_gp029 [Bacillus phage AvesoBmore]ALA13494.1 hypothetical protein AVESOBMORE_29 [Bacillus phage AvesoBmore]